MSCMLKPDKVLVFSDTGAGKSRETGGSVKGRAESTQGLITEAAAQQQNPEEQVRNETDEDESVDSFDYFARPQTQDIHMFSSYNPQQTPIIAIPKVFNSKDGTNRKWFCKALLV